MFANERMLTASLSRTPTWGLNCGAGGVKVMLGLRLLFSCQPANSVLPQVLAYSIELALSICSLFWCFRVVVRCWPAPDSGLGVLGLGVSGGIEGS
jgi:hypothetical protein